MMCYIFFGTVFICQDILYADDDEQVVLPDPAEKFDELLSRFELLEHLRDLLAFVDFIFSDGPEQAFEIVYLDLMKNK